MNRFLLVFNCILLLALGYLYYAFYTKPAPAKLIKKTTDTALNHIKLAYFDMDTLEKYYEYAKETRDYLKRKNDEAESKLTQIKNSYAAKVNDYKKSGERMSQTEQSQDFKGEYMQKMLDLKNRIQAFLKKYSIERGYAYVFATSSDDNVIYFKDSVRNITTELVNNLNEEYRSSKKK